MALLEVVFNQKSLYLDVPDETKDLPFLADTTGKAADLTFVPTDVTERFYQCVCDAETSWSRQEAETDLSVAITEVSTFLDQKGSVLDLTGVSLQELVRSYGASMRFLFEAYQQADAQEHPFQSKTQTADFRTLMDNYKIKIENIEFSIAPFMGYGHANARILSLGSYVKIYTFMNDNLTNDNRRSEQQLAKLLLKFCCGAFEFKQEHLVTINEKFAQASADVVNKVGRQLTMIAYLYCMFEVIRRKNLGFDSTDTLLIEHPFMCAQLACLKLVEKGTLRLQEIFSQDAEYSLAAHANVTKNMDMTLLFKPICHVFNDFIENLEKNSEFKAAHARLKNQFPKGAFIPSAPFAQKLFLYYGNNPAAAITPSPAIVPCAQDVNSSNCTHPKPFFPSASSTTPSIKEWTESFCLCQ